MQELTENSDSVSLLWRREIFLLINYAGSGHVNFLRFEQSHCVLVRRTIYHWDAPCLYSPLVIVGKSLHKLCFSQQIFHALNERRQKSKSDTKSLAPNTARTTTFSSVLSSVSLHKYCSFSTFIVVNQYI